MAFITSISFSVYEASDAETFFKALEKHSSLGIHIQRQRYTPVPTTKPHDPLAIKVHVCFEFHADVEGLDSATREAYPAIARSLLLKVARDPKVLGQRVIYETLDFTNGGCTASKVRNWSSE